MRQHRPDKPDKPYKQFTIHTIHIYIALENFKYPHPSRPRMTYDGTSALFHTVLHQRETYLQKASK